ncbi:NDR1/HIN1-like protein 12 [Vigna radiata var. radiata]|uniref:NDR1/HIN1-like protein 12 n=1 Tax=Vigna radiata var. radiata TaxID=3916 RepID=A0A1S3VQD9_VIGRR|nr:NDR1/HIN1-like protein 12 [Vigna radiata var. radiata]
MPSSHRDHGQAAEYQNQNQNQHHPHHYRRKLVNTHHDRNTHPLIWLAAILCTIIAIGVVVAGIVVFVGYMVIHPRIPVISVTKAHLDLLSNDYAGLLQTQLTIIVVAQNGNARAHATFSDINFNLSYQGQPIARMVAETFDVPRNSSKTLNYVVRSASIPLTPDQMEEVDESWKRDVIGFDLKGSARTRWRVGALGSVKFWSNLECELKFRPSNGSYIKHSRCTSESK